MATGYSLLRITMVPMAVLFESRMAWRSSALAPFCTGLAAGRQVVGGPVVDRVDVGQIDEVGDLDQPRPRGPAARAPRP